MNKSGFTLAEVEICPPRGPILHEIKISAKGGAVRSEAETRGSEGKLSASECVSEILPKSVAISKQAFTLAEVLITLAIIGVVAALTIPSVISNSQQQEFKTGLRKAVSVLNSAITTSIALDGETPYDNIDLTRYLMRHMNVLKSTSAVPYSSYTAHSSGQLIHGGNSAFYTTDGMRFEFNAAISLSEGKNKLHESDVYACTATSSLRGDFGSGGMCNTSSGLIECSYCGGCGSLGLGANPNNTTKPSCLILVDVNGDKKPTPGNVNCKTSECGQKSNVYKVPFPGEKKVRDIFSILITEDRAIPYGVTAQKAMYNSQH